MQKHHQKPKSSQFKNIGEQRQKEGRIKTNSGHLFVPHEEDRNSEFNEQSFKDDARKSKSVKRKEKKKKKRLRNISERKSK